MEGANALLTAVTNGLSTVITWVGTTIDSVISADGALNPLLPLFAVGIAISAVLLGIKLMRNIVWGA